MNRSIGSISVIPLSVLTLALLGCASSMNQVQPGRVIMDRSGINYPGDSQDCRRIAESYDYTEPATNQAIQDGVTAGVIGGIAGAAIGSFSGHAGSGAGIGAIVGVGTQAISSATDQHEDATRVWANCMSSRGYAIYSVR